jgi:DNA-binding response OmpR family regulator
MLAVAECARLRAERLSVPLLLVALEPAHLRHAAERVGVTEVLRSPLAADEVRAFVNGERAESTASELGANVVLDREARLLSVRGVEQPISVQKFNLLCYLADRPGRAVDPRELVRAGVIRSTQVPRMRALIAELRRVLGPAGNLVRTVPGFGYRFELPP